MWGNRVVLWGWAPLLVPSPHHALACTSMLLLQVQPDLATNGERLACYKGSPLLTSAGPCSVRSIVGGGIK